MAIKRPQAIDDAPSGPERSAGWWGSDFLVSAMNGEAQGTKPWAVIHFGALQVSRISR
jgi:hypothetical protein